MCKKHLVLDVGCGRDPHGDINMDIYRPWEHNPHTRKPPLPKINNFILADAHHLPFKPSIFSKIICYEVMEHLENPFKALKEMVRVLKSNGEIEITTPHRMMPMNNPTHKQHFTRSWFKKASTHLNCLCHVTVIAWRFLPHPYITLIRLPAQLKITIKKPK